MFTDLLNFCWNKIVQKRDLNLMKTHFFTTYNFYLPECHPKKKEESKSLMWLSPTVTPKLERVSSKNSAPHVTVSRYNDVWCRETVRAPEPLLWAESLAGKPERLFSLIARPWKAQASPGATSISGCICSTPASTSPETKCPSQVLPEIRTRHISSPTSTPSDCD